MVASINNLKGMYIFTSAIPFIHFVNVCNRNEVRPHITLQSELDTKIQELYLFIESRYKVLISAVSFKIAQQGCVTSEK